MKSVPKRQQKIKNNKLTKATPSEIDAKIRQNDVRVINEARAKLGRQPLPVRDTR